jgi:hypothetical protein
MSHHEKIEADEIFIGNARTDSARLEWLKANGITTARFGKVAYDIDGSELPKPYLPIFINRSDADHYDRVMMTETFGSDWRRNR